MQAIDPLQQGLRQRAEARPDLDHEVAALRRDRRNDLFDDPRRIEEILSEALARDVADASLGRFGALRTELASTR